MDEKKTENSEEQPVKDLPAKPVDPKSGETVKGGEVDHSEFKIVKFVDATTPKLHE